VNIAVRLLDRRVSLRTRLRCPYRTMRASGSRWLPSQQRPRRGRALRDAAAAINKWLRQACLALHVAGLGHGVCSVIAVLISVGAPKLTGRGLEESGES